MNTPAVADAYKKFCLQFLDDLFVKEHLPVLTIPKVNASGAEVLVCRKLQCVDTSKTYAATLAVAAVIGECVFSK